MNARRVGMAGRIVALSTGLALAADAAAPPAPREYSRPKVEAALTRGVAFLLKSQNPDGSWGGAADSITTWSGWTWSNPESHRAWRVATTGLACMALLEVGNSEETDAAVERSLDYLIANALVKRPSGVDTMSCWAFIYGLQALAKAYCDPRYADWPRRDELCQAAQTHLRQLAYHQSLSGGWGYLEFDRPRTARPQWATSFTTGAAVVALADARDAGLDVDAVMLRRAVKAVRRCWLPNGAYTYSVRAIPHPRTIGSINRVKGSLCRIQTCNLALLLGGDEIGDDRLRTGLDQLFEHHRFIDIALHKPIPHETYYQNSGYFYLFGHYYAARVIQQLPADVRPAYWPKLQYELIKIQQKDGSLWDYDHHAYDKPYGTAFALMALGRSVRDAAPAEREPARPE